MKTEMKFLRAPVAALLFVAALGASVPATALANDKVATARVQVSDLDLSTARGQRGLERRTANAIEQVCPLRGSAMGPRSTTNAAHRECAQSVRLSVKEQVGDHGARAVAGRK
jgi:UrcA family protein